MWMSTHEPPAVPVNMGLGPDLSAEQDLVVCGVRNEKLSLVRMTCTPNNSKTDGVRDTR
jgi:hypothetical protein